MPYALQPMLRIRTRREDRAASASSAAASACRAAVSSPVARSSRIVRILKSGWRVYIDVKS